MVYQSLSLYLSALHSPHILEGFPYMVGESARPKRAMLAIMIKNPAPKQKLPITYDILIPAIPSIGLDTVLLIPTTYNLINIWF